jgi:hypothetical protein
LLTYRGVIFAEVRLTLLWYSTNPPGLFDTHQYGMMPSRRAAFAHRVITAVERAIAAASEVRYSGVVFYTPPNAIRHASVGNDSNQTVRHPLTVVVAVQRRRRRDRGKHRRHHRDRQRRDQRSVLHHCQHQAADGAHDDIDENDENGRWLGPTVSWPAIFRRCLHNRWRRAGCGPARG